MVEGMVIELYNNYVVVMTKTGEFLKLRKRGIVNVGDIYKEKVYRKIPLFTYAAAAALIFAFTSLAGYTAYANQIVGYVDIRGERDVRLYVSRSGTVEKIDGIQNSNNIKDLPVDQAIEELNEIASSEGIFSDTSKVKVVTTKLKESKLDLDRINDNVRKILIEDKKSKEKNTDKTKKENNSKIKVDSNNSNDNKDNTNEIKKDTSKNSNGSGGKIKTNNEKVNNNKGQGSKNGKTENNKFDGKNNNNKSKDNNGKNNLIKFLNSKYNKYFKHK